MSASNITLATGISAAVAIAVGLSIALVTNGVSRPVTATMLAGITIAAGLIASRRPSYRGERNSVTALESGGWPVRWIVLTVITCSALTGILGYLNWRLYMTPPPSSFYTSLGITPRAAHSVIVVTSHDKGTKQFLLTVSRSNRVIDSRSFRLESGATYDLVIPGETAPARTDHYSVRLMIEPGNRLYRSLKF